MPMGTDDRKHRLLSLEAATALANERFTALQGAFEAVESAHKRGDFSPASAFYHRVEEFRSAAAEVHRLAGEVRHTSDTPLQPKPLE